MGYGEGSGRVLRDLRPLALDETLDLVSEGAVDERAHAVSEAIHGLLHLVTG